MDAITEAIKAHRECKLCRVRRDNAIRQAHKGGMTAYAIAKRFREELGERNGLTAEGVRLIVKGKADMR